jgi:hypothetical protein
MRVLGVETGQQLLHWSWTITPSKIPGRAGLVISAMPVDRVRPKDIQAGWEFVPCAADTLDAEYPLPCRVVRQRPTAGLVGGSWNRWPSLS